MARSAVLQKFLVGVLGAAALSGCDQPGPLSAAAKGHLPERPATPSWAAPLAWRPLKSVFPGEARCLGFVDGPADRYQDGRRVTGWAWNASAADTPARLAVVNEKGLMVGFGEGGMARPDVTAARPEVRSGTTGWWVVTPTKKPSYAIWLLDEANRSACRVGDVAL